MVADLLEKSFGKEKAELARVNDWSELAQVKMVKGDVAWERMLGARESLQEWVNSEVSKAELWTATPCAELEQLHELDIIDLTTDDTEEVAIATTEDDSDSDATAGFILNSSNLLTCARRFGETVVYYNTATTARRVYFLVSEAGV